MNAGLTIRKFAFKPYLARALFAIGRRFCRAEFNAIVSEAALGVASGLSVQIMRESFVREGLAVCRHPAGCAQRFGLKRTADGYRCQLHAPVETPALI